MIAAKVQRAEHLLEQITNKLGISDEGRDFLIANLDPMHDNQLKHLAGWPDIEGAASIVRCIKQSTTIKSPFTTGTVWDCHVMAHPFLHEIMGRPGTITGSVGEESIAVGADRPVGGVQAWAVPTGQPIDLISGASGINFAPVVAANMSLDPVFDKGTGRLVGAGIEIVNTTSPLNRQGLCTVYRQPQAKETTGTMLYSGAVEFAGQAYTGQFFRAPPVTLSVATLYPGSRSWPAEEGAYLVVPFIGSNNKPKSCSPFCPVLTTDASCQQYNNITSRPMWVARKGQLSSIIATPSFKSEPVHTVGAYFTGLSAETTLTITWNVYYETFPSIDEREILVLSTPSARYDPKALEVLNYALATLPVGVPASFNPLGEWFWDVVNSIADIAPMIGGVLGGPTGAMIGAGVRKGAKHIAKYNTPPSPMTNTKDLMIRKAEKDKQKKKTADVSRDVVLRRRK